MHFKILVEDQSGAKALRILVSKIVGSGHTVDYHSYKGIGSIPSGMKAKSDPNKRILLDHLPRLLCGIGKTFAAYPKDYRAVVVVVCDLDQRCLKTFRAELLGIIEKCNPCPEVRFCIAVEEGEAWLLGDIDAVKAAYRNAKDYVLRAYRNDSVCGTWEKLADAVYPGGSQKLSEQGWQVIGAEKSKWAEKIAPHMDVGRNKSPSFQYFCSKLRDLSCQIIP